MTDYDKLKLDELKALLKTANMVMAGDKGTLIWRLKLLDTCNKKQLVDSVFGKNPCNLKMSELTKACAREGVSPIGNQDELLGELVKQLEKKAPAATASASTYSNSNGSSNSNSNKATAISESAEGGGGGGIDPIAIARRVLELNEVDDYEAILNIATVKGQPLIVKTSPSTTMRKAYLKISLLIHPDKIGRVFAEATKAFQALVRAFERLSSPDLTSEEDTKKGGKGKKEEAKTIARSNHNCFRTRVKCPRCKQAWSEGGLDGNPPYFYNFLMTGLKQYSCSTCLMEFGCMTAGHACPFCSKGFEYSISDFHRQIKCENPKCEKTFGFMMYPASDKVMREMKETVKAEQETRIRLREQKMRRMARNSTRAVGGIDQEKAFLMGLSDICPRCGETLEQYGEEEQREHLTNCTDPWKHKQHKEQVAQKQQAQKQKEEKKEKQDAAQSNAVWQFLGAKSGQLWLMDDEGLRIAAKESGLSTTGDKNTLISRIAADKKAKGTSNDAMSSDDEDDEGNSGKKRSRMMIENKSSASTSLVVTSASKKSKKSSAVKIDNLPSNLHSLSLSELQGICAANGVLHLLPQNAVKSDILDFLEGKIYGEEVIGDETATGSGGKTLMIKGGGGGGGGGRDKDDDDDVYDLVSSDSDHD